MVTFILGTITGGTAVALYPRAAAFVRRQVARLKGWLEAAQDD